MVFLFYNNTMLGYQYPRGSCVCVVALGEWGMLIVRAIGNWWLQFACVNDDVGWLVNLVLAADDRLVRQASVNCTLSL